MATKRRAQQLLAQRRAVDAAHEQATRLADAARRQQTTPAERRAYRREQRKRQLPPDLRCPGCRRIVSNTARWAVMHDVRATPQTKETVRVVCCRSCWRKFCTGDMAIEWIAEKPEQPDTSNLE